MKGGYSRLDGASVSAHGWEGTPGRQRTCIGPARADKKAPWEIFMDNIVQFNYSDLQCDEHGNKVTNALLRRRTKNYHTKLKIIPFKQEDLPDQFKVWIPYPVTSFFVFGGSCYSWQLQLTDHQSQSIIPWRSSGHQSSFPSSDGEADSWQSHV